MDFGELRMQNFDEEHPQVLEKARYRCNYTGQAG